MPITPNPVEHTLKLLENVIADLDDVEEHFQKPFAVYARQPAAGVTGGLARANH